MSADRGAHSVKVRRATSADLDRLLACRVVEPVSAVTADKLRRGLVDRSYRPEWIWLAEEGEEVVARAVCWGMPGSEHPMALDCLYADPRVADPVALCGELVAGALRAVPDGGEPLAYHLFLPIDWRRDPEVSAAVGWRVEAARRAGMSDQVERWRYEWTPESGVPADPGRLRFAASDDDEAFVAVMARVTDGSLDADTRHAVARGGAEGCAREQLAIYRAMPGERGWWRLAYAGGDLVGFAIPSANDNGPVVGYLGVVPEARGRGYAGELLAEITRILAADGAERIRADTDMTNRPMAAAFERGGYRCIAVRLVCCPAAVPGGGDPAQGK